ncbi:MAG TPA: type II toxin-antitoxin system VapC family toxin [Chloroflexota bacterium]|nr:type II toxin-antitoxin system VapC family toxin [Chloroflexota bacterium]
MIVYADTSALGSVYLRDEADAPWLRDLLDNFNSVGTLIVTSELTDVELASLVARAARSHRIDGPTAEDCLRAYAADTANSGPIGVLLLDRETLARAAHYVVRTATRSLDAIHLAAAAHCAEQFGDDVQVLTRDVRQAAAAAALGIPLHPRSTTD